MDPGRLTGACILVHCRTYDTERVPSYIPYNHRSSRAGLPVSAPDFPIPMPGGVRHLIRPGTRTAQRCQAGRSRQVGRVGIFSGPRWPGTGGLCRGRGAAQCVFTVSAIPCLECDSSLHLSIALGFCRVVCLFFFPILGTSASLPRPHA